jgi:hypothetical protein
MREQLGSANAAMFEDPASNFRPIYRTFDDTAGIHVLPLRNSLNKSQTSTDRQV